MWRRRTSLSSSVRVLVSAATRDAISLTAPIVPNTRTFGGKTSSSTDDSGCSGVRGAPHGATTLRGSSPCPPPADRRSRRKLAKVTLAPALTCRGASASFAAKAGATA